METNSSTKFMTDRTYNCFRLSATILLPGISALYFGLAEIWDFPAQAQVSGSIAVVNVFVGVLLAFAKALYDSSGAKYDGILNLEGDKDGNVEMKLQSISYEALETKPEIIFKVNKRNLPSAPVA